MPARCAGFLYINAKGWHLMQKFRIVPSQKNMFWQLVLGMRLEEE